MCWTLSIWTLAACLDLVYLDPVCMDPVCLDVWTLSVWTLSIWTLSVWTLSVWTLSVWTLAVPGPRNRLFWKMFKAFGGPASFFFRLAMWTQSTWEDVLQPLGPRQTNPA